MNKNRVLIASAGSGKTTFIVDKALAQKEERVLITTFTRANEAEIRKKIIEKNKFIPENITIQTWYSFLLKHGARPFQGVLFNKKIQGLLLVSSKSGLKGYKKPCPECKQSGIIKPCKKCQMPFYYGENEIENFYFTKTLKIYSDKLSKFVYSCNKKTNGLVIKRFSQIFSHVFIDEVQDLAGYDLELLKLLFVADINLLLVGDPRQGTYSTNNSAKNKKFGKMHIVDFFNENSTLLDINDTKLHVNHRCNKYICDFSNKLYPDFPETNSDFRKMSEHDGIFFVKEIDVNSYLEKYRPMQLRDSNKKRVDEKYMFMNFGESKGLSFDRVLIYPTQLFLDWLKDNNSELGSTSRSKLYVAITRARYSVGIVVKNDEINIEGIQYWHL
jgi:superfamily I DNA/RNA helicase